MAGLSIRGQGLGAGLGACPPGFSGRKQWKFLTQRSLGKVGGGGA